MSKRIVLDLERHEAFFDVLSKHLPLNINKSTATTTTNNKKKRKRAETTQGGPPLGDLSWDTTNVEFHIRTREHVWKVEKVNFNAFSQAVKRVVADSTWMQRLGEERSVEWHVGVPSFLYSILCNQPVFCKATGTDPTMASVFSVGRYLYLRSVSDVHKVETPLRKHIITRMVVWLLLKEKGHQDARRLVSLVEKTLYDGAWWDTDLTPEDKLAGATSLDSDRALVEDIVKTLNDEKSINVARWVNFFQDLPEVLEKYHTKATNPDKGDYAKTAFGETSTTNKNLPDTIKILRNYKLWADLACLRRYNANTNKELTTVLFEEQGVTTDQIHTTMRTLFDEWGKWWAKGVDTIQGRYLVIRTPKGVMMVAPSSWILEIQERLLPFLCVHPSFHRRYPVPIAPWLTEKYFSGRENDREVVMRTLYRLIHMYTRGNSKSLLATPEDRDIFCVYEYLHEILDHFSDENHIMGQFKLVFEDCENLYFQKRKGKSEDEEVLMGIKNIPCLQRALKSILEIKAPHYLGPVGFNVLDQRNLLGVEGLPRQEGLLTREETIAVYKLCSTNRLGHREALQVFYDTYVQGEILFTATLSGAESWSRVAPFLQSYNTKVLKKINTKTEESGRKPCVALYYTFRIAEEMTHYPFRLTRKDYADESKPFRGRIQSTPLHCDPRDFLVNDCRCPLMLKAESGNGSPKSWFSEDLFPLYTSKIIYGLTGNQIPHPWADLRPFEDADPMLLELLVTQ